MDVLRMQRGIFYVLGILFYYFYTKDIYTMVIFVLTGLEKVEKKSPV